VRFLEAEDAEGAVELEELGVRRRGMGGVLGPGRGPRRSRGRPVSGVC
jgi:hypothetical protein